MWPCTIAVILLFYHYKLTLWSYSAKYNVWLLAILYQFVASLSIRNRGGFRSGRASSLITANDAVATSGVPTLFDEGPVYSIRRRTDGGLLVDCSGEPALPH